MQLTTEILNQLKAPFPVSEIKFKIQAKLKNDPTKAIVVPYLDARNVMERLDEVVGPAWSDSYREVNVGDKNGVECTINLFGEVSRADVGDPNSDGMDDSMKSAYSDAFKRAAVKFGIGRFLYASPRMYAKVNGSYIDKDELPKLKLELENFLANLAVGKIMQETHQERVFSIEHLEEVIKSGVAATHDEAAEILRYSVLKEDVSMSVLTKWLDKYAKAGKDTIMGCAEVANTAYMKAKEKKNA